MEPAPTSASGDGLAVVLLFPDGIGVVYFDPAPVKGFTKTELAENPTPAFLAMEGVSNN